MNSFLALVVFSLVFSFSWAQAQVEDWDLGESQTSVEAQKTDKKKYYAGIGFGLEAYPQVSNVDKGYNFSGSFGYYLKENIMLEIGLGAAKSQLTQTNLLYPAKKDTFNVDQYQVGTVAKYALNDFAESRFIPSFGLALTYTYRSYNLLNGLTTNSGHTGNSGALDAGLDAGLDYAFNNKYAAGLNFKYMFNLGNQITSNYSNPTYGYNGYALEGFQYYIAGLSARMNF